MKKYEQTLGDVIKQMVNDSKKMKKNLMQTKIRNLWETLMGTTINNYTRELRFIKGKLYVSIDAAPLKQELTYGREKIKKMLNDELGEEAIIDVIIR